MREALVFARDSEAFRWLGQADPDLGQLIGLLKEISLSLPDDMFAGLAVSIASQQLSGKAADAILGRVRVLCGALTPDTLLSADAGELRGCGLSVAKVRYLQGLAQAVREGSLVLHELSRRSDDEVVRALTAVKGIGRWSAEMFLIFSLGRLDVLSFGDAGIRRAVRWLYGDDGEERLVALRETWSPYSTVASLCLWAAVDRGYTRHFAGIDEAVAARG